MKIVVWKIQSFWNSQLFGFSMDEYFEHTKILITPKTSQSKRNSRKRHIHTNSVWFKALAEDTEYRKCINIVGKWWIVQHARAMHVNLTNKNARVSFKSAYCCILSMFAQSISIPHKSSHIHTFREKERREKYVECELLLSLPCLCELHIPECWRSNSMHVYSEYVTRF